LRRALLFRRRGGLWRELPADTQWWEVELGAEEVARLRFFPRAFWRKLSRGNFYVTDIVERIRTVDPRTLPQWFRERLETFDRVLREDAVPSSVILISTDEGSPLTIIEGNHRVAAAMLISEDVLRSRLRFLCGFSPRMPECCWYRSSLLNLCRYAANRVRHITYDPEADMERVVRIQGGTPAIS
jgi:hypothetical protein